MNNVIDRVRIIRKVRLRIMDRLGDMAICPECLDEVLSIVVDLEERERDHDELAKIKDPDLGL